MRSRRRRKCPVAPVRSGRAGGDRREFSKVEGAEAASSRLFSPLPFPVVGVAVAADGLELLRELLGAVPPGTGFAFVAVPACEGLFRKALSSLPACRTALKVEAPLEGAHLEPDHLYLLAPGFLPSVQVGRLELRRPGAGEERTPQIDSLFRSLAREYRERSAVVLLGSPAGVPGLQEVKLFGGAILAVAAPAGSEPAREQRLPEGLVDQFLPVEQVPDTLIRLFRREGGHPAGGVDDLTENLGRIVRELTLKTGCDFRSYRTPTIARRVGRRMAAGGFAKSGDYLERLRQSPQEVEALFQELLIGVTGFFRDPEAFRFLEEEVIPELVERQAGAAPVRVWVPGCSTGEEAYSLVMLFLERFRARRKEPRLQVFATDINRKSIVSARQGVYVCEIAAQVSPERLQRFFLHEGDSHYRVNRNLRNPVIFAAHDLLRDPPFSRLDLLSCRNVLIYLDPAAHQKLFRLFHYALKPDGYLFLGPCEEAARQVDLFEPVSRQWKVYRRTESGRAREALRGPHDQKRFGGR